MAMFSKKHEHEGRTVAVFDIGSASVGVALAVLSANRKPKVIFHTRMDMAFQEDLDFERFVSSMTETLRTVVERLNSRGLEHLNKNRAHIDDVVVAYASPWYTTKTQVLEQKKKKPFQVTKKVVDELIASQKLDLEDEAKMKGQVGERKITSIELNGYPVKDLTRELSAKKVRVAVSATMIPEAVIKAVEDLLGDVAVNSKITHQSFAMVACTAIRDIFHTMTDFLIIDVTGEVCDVIFAKKEALLETASFPMGRYDLYRELQRELKVDVHTVQGKLSAYAQGGLEKTIQSKLEILLDAIQIEWKKAFLRAIDHFAHEMTLPSTIFFVSEAATAPIFKKFIEESHTEGLFDARHVQPVVLKGHVTFPERAVGDAFLGLGVYFAQRLLFKE